VRHSGSWACVTNRQVKAKADETASGMGVRPPGIGLQGLVPNHLVLLRSKDVVVSDGETADWICQVCDEKVSVSEPLMTRRYPFQTLSKRGAAQIPWNSVDRTCLWATRQPAYRRHELIAGPDAERENLPWNAKGASQVVTTMRVNTDVCGRGGATRSSDEGSVMDSEPRGCVIPFGVFHQLPTAGGMG
jgi:hypothetical protein